MIDLTLKFWMEINPDLWNYSIGISKDKLIARGFTSLSQVFDDTSRIDFSAQQDLEFQE